MSIGAWRTSAGSRDTPISCTGRSRSPLLRSCTRACRRTRIRDGPDEPGKYNYRFKHMTTVGEPIEPEVWKWYFNVVGKKQAVIVDTWWQTETGGFLCSTMPGIHKMKPGSAGPGIPGIHPVIYDDEGKELKAGSGKAGNICIRNPWPGIMQTIWRDSDRFVRVYYSRYCKDPKSKNWRDWPDRKSVV